MLNLHFTFPQTPKGISDASLLLHKAQLCGVSKLYLSWEQHLPHELWISQAPYSHRVILGLLVASLTPMALYHPHKNVSWVEAAVVETGRKNSGTGAWRYTKRSVNFP